MIVSILTGFAAGAIHVVGGVDHLVAMAPGAMRKPRAALRNGLAWGLGHSAGVLFLSLVAILIKDLAHIERMSSWAEFTVGMSLLVVGVMAVRTSLGLDIHTHEHVHRNGLNHEHVHVHVHMRGEHMHARHPHASTSLGLLHGLAGASHLLAVMPALALPPMGAFAYLLAYLLGSVVAMGSVVVALSMATFRAGRRLVPVLFGLTGGLSIVTGCVWIQKTSIQIF